MKGSDSIVAIATAPGRGGIGIVRISGPDLSPFINGLIGKTLPPRHASHVRFRAEDGATLDDGIALYFPATEFFYRRACARIAGSWRTACHATDR